MASVFPRKPDRLLIALSLSLSLRFSLAPSLMMKRRFGNRHITVETQEMLVSDLSPSMRFQTREHDNAKVRGDEIARACLADGRTTSTSSVHQEDGVNDIPAGLGRRCGAIKLGWERLNVDIVKGPKCA